MKNAATVSRAASLREGAGVAVLVALAAGVFVALAPAPDLVGITAVAVGLAIVGMISYTTPEVRSPLLTAFALRAGASLCHAYLFPLPGGGLDAVGFEQIGYGWSRLPWNGLMSMFKSGALLYSWLIALMYWFTGRSPLMMQVVNSFLGTLVVYNVFATARLVWGVAPARKAAWVAALFPTLVLFSALTLREVMVGYPLTLGALWFARWRLTDRVGWVILTVGALAIAIAFHTVIVGAVGYVAYAVMSRSFGSLAHGKVGSSVKALIGAGVVAALFAALLLTGWGAFGPAYWTTVLTNFDPVRAYQGGGHVDRTDYLTWMPMNGPTDVWQLPVRLVWFLFMPFPWLVRATVDIIGLLDGLLYVWLVWHLRRVIKPVWRAPAASGVFGMMMSVTLVFALVVSNYGTAIRHRGKIAPLLIVVAAGSLVRKRGEPVDPLLIPR